LTIEKSVHHVNIYIDHSRWNLQNSIICVFQDASSEFKEEENLKRLKKIDFLTNLHSQFKANSDINQMIVEAQKESKQLAIYILGINDFEKLKSTYGLTYTNDLLKKFAGLLKVLEADNAFGYRLDCDSFLYVVKDIEGEKDALEKGIKISKTITQFFKLNNKKTYFTFSAGIVLFPEHGKNANQLLDHAFIALAESKEKLDGTVEIFKKENLNTQTSDMLLTNEIKLGLDRKEFEIYYQPIIDLQTEQIMGAEALIRWNHPRFGLIPPGRFIHLAELSGLIKDIGEYVLKEVIYQHKRWSDYGFKNIEISINISARELLVYKPEEKLEKLFADYKVNPANFSFNISECDMMQNIQKTELAFSIMKKIGVNLSVNHFGTGGSSIELLRRLPIHRLKIDQSLLMDIDKDIYHQETTRAITLLAKELNVKTVAEKVESKGQYTVLKKIGCDYAYGYIFSRPSPVFEFQELLRK
jgi:diguanylate cyclase (GGDEF)-like protein